MERFAGRYALVRPLGQGGMGHVWLALDLTTGVECALKRLEVRLAAAELESLRNEFEVLARLRHPAIVGVHELGTSRGGQPYYTMDYVPGLAADVALEGAGLAALFEVAARVSEGLEALHGAGIVHGDIKPSNLLVLPGGLSGSGPAGVRLVDFGLSALLDRERVGHRGTAGFAAPEVVQGQPLSVASDLYSFGATLYVLAVTAARGPGSQSNVRPPRDAEWAALSLQEHGILPAFAELVVRLLARAPESRPESAHAVSRWLAEFAPHSRRSLTDRLDSEQVIGRGRELARLEHWLASGSTGVPLVLLTGESGVGKSTLLRELTVRAQLAGRPVISLTCREGNAHGEVARTLLLRLAAAAEAVQGPHVPHAELRARLERGELPTDVDLAARAGLQWGSMVREHAAHVLVMLDDLEHLDSQSFALVKRWVTAEGPFRWMWASAAATLHEEQSVWIESGLAESMPLGALANEGAHQLIAARLRAEPPSGLAQELWSRCGGHPGLTVEALRLAASSGALEESGSGITLDREVLDRLRVSTDYTAACSRRLDGLSADAVVAAAVLAVWAEPVSHEQAQRLDARVRRVALDALAASGIIALDDAGRLAFQAPALARAVLDRLPAAERESLHRQAAGMPGLSAHTSFRLWRGAGEPVRALHAADTALREHADLRLTAEAAVLAAEAVPDQATDWAARAGLLLMERGRYREARSFLQQAIEWSPGDPRASYWRTMLAGALFRTGEHAELEVLLSTTLAQAMPDRERSMLIQSVASLHAARGEMDDNLAVLEESLVLAQRSADPEALGLALFGRASGLRWQNRHIDRALEDIQRAIRELERTPRDGVRLRAMAVHAQILLATHRAIEAEAVASTALAEARVLQARLAEFELCETLIQIRSELGHWQEVRGLAQHLLRIALEEGLPGQAALGQLHLDVINVLMGDHRHLLAHARQALSRVRRHQRLLEPTLCRMFGILYRDRGRLQLAMRWLRRGAAGAARHRSEYEQRWAAIERGALLARAGRWKQAAAIWQAAWQLHAELDSPTVCVLRALAARARLRLGDLPGAQQDAAEIAGWLAVRHGEYAKAQLLVLRAELGLMAADLTAAPALVREALATFARLPSPAERAWAAVECSRLAIQRGLDGQLPVHDWLREAAEAYDLTGDRRGREQALALAVDWYRRHSPATVRMHRDRDLLQAVNRLLDSMSDFEQLTREAMRLAVEQLDAERGVLLLVSSEAGEDAGVTLEPVVEFGAVDAETRDHALTYSRDIVHRVRETGGSLVLRDARTEGERLSHSMVTLGLRSVLCVPLFVRSRLVGAVYLDDSRRAEAFGDSERTLLEGFAELLAVAIENSRGQARARRDYEQLFDENLSLRREASVRYRPHNIIGGSLALQRVMSVVERAAATDTTVLISGENGTGKELVARMLHHAGARTLKPFVAVNCGALTATLLESELFGILADVASGVKARPGRFVEADGGTLFLDEIGEMPVQQQVALLRVLSTGTVTPVGGGRPIAVSVRVIAATNRDLMKDIEDGRFRQDLWYRLNVIPVEIPPLRERRADIPALAQHFVAVFASQQGRELPELSPALMSVLMQGGWPGNVRELQNYIERLMAMTPGKVLRPDPLPHDLQMRARSIGRLDRGRTLREMVAELERRQLQEALERHGGNQSEAARELGLTEQSFRYRLRRYALTAKRHFQRTR